MVQFRNIKADVFHKAGFSSKKEAIAYLAEKGQTGHKFQSTEAVVAYLMANPKKTEQLPEEEMKDEERAANQMAKLNLSESESEDLPTPVKQKKKPVKKALRKARKRKTKNSDIPEDELYDPTDVPELQVMSD